MAVACGVRAHRWSRFDGTEIVVPGKSKLRKIFTCLWHGAYPRSVYKNAQILWYIQRAFRKRAKRAVIPPKCSNHLTECKKGAGRQHTTFTSCQNAACSKNCFLWWVYYILGSTLWMSKCEFCRLFHTERSWHAYWFSAVIVSGRHDLPSDARALSSTSFET